MTVILPSVCGLRRQYNIDLLIAIGVERNKLRIFNRTPIGVKRFVHAMTDHFLRPRTRFALLGYNENVAQPCNYNRGQRTCISEVGL